MIDDEHLQEFGGGAEDEVRVAFPATEDFTRIGRVAAVGLALRLGIDVATVERLRGAVDQSVSALRGSGRIEATANWNRTRFEITLTNPEAAIDGPVELVGLLTPLVDKAEVETDRITLTLSLGRNEP